MSSNPAISTSIVTVWIPLEIALRHDSLEGGNVVSPPVPCRNWRAALSTMPRPPAPPRHGFAAHPPAAFEALAATPDPARSAVWRGGADNPYEGWLGLADAVVVTSDSVNMATEACATGRPVLLAHLPGGSDKFARFHDALRRGGHAGDFEGAIDFAWKPVALDDTGTVAGRVTRLLAG